jgi:hypothetical protein
MIAANLIIIHNPLQIENEKIEVLDKSVLQDGLKLLKTSRIIDGDDEENIDNTSRSDKIILEEMTSKGQTTLFTKTDDVYQRLILYKPIQSNSPLEFLLANVKTISNIQSLIEIQLYLLETYMLYRNNDTQNYDGIDKYNILAKYYLKNLIQMATTFDMNTRLISWGRGLVNDKGQTIIEDPTMINMETYLKYIAHIFGVYHMSVLEYPQVNYQYLGVEGLGGLLLRLFMNYFDVSLPDSYAYGSSINLKNWGNYLNRPNNILVNSYRNSNVPINQMNRRQMKILIYRMGYTYFRTKTGQGYKYDLLIEMDPFKISKMRNIVDFLVPLP